ncbi:MAG: chloride channel protein [Verrucomicrobia bacterium]|nr:chloride channel protein [Verrucomicrobiota bacterium]MDE3098176.1 chloride channel protein [Verrucomicrobiota bacterium]
MYKRLTKQLSEIEQGATFLRKWGLVGVLIGVGAGLGSLALLWSITFVNHYALGMAVGYTPPMPGGEGGGGHYIYQMARPWLLPCVTGAAGLIGGLIVWKLAPETAGIGTNAAIRAFHNGEKIGFRTSLIKLVTSAITIGGGLTSGREGPVAQIGAATGASIARLLKLPAKERNVALAAGLGAGIAAIFKAPLAGAIIGAEIFYTEDFEVEALVPGLIASVIGYTIVGSVIGFQPIFTPPPESNGFGSPLSLFLYAFLGISCGLLARVMFGIYFRVERFFQRYPLWLATTIGGCCTGLLGLAVPAVLGTGYGWAQFAITGGNMASWEAHPSLLMAAAFAEIVGASLTLGSGNSGGIFGPSVVTGGLFGGIFGVAANHLMPSLAPHPGDFAIVGMVAFFGAAAKAPISTIVMISEMTGGYSLLAPAMFAVVAAFILSGRKTIFPAQVPSRLDSPFHGDEFEPIVLRHIKTSDVMVHLPVFTNKDATVADAMSLMGDYGLAGLPVAAGHKLCGRVTLLAAHRVPEARRREVKVGEIMSGEVHRAFPHEDLFTILKRFAAKDVGHLPVVTPENPDVPIGLITRSGLWSALETVKERRAGKAEPRDMPDPASF